jgi:hypothetical protein
MVNIIIPNVLSIDVINGDNNHVGKMSLIRTLTLKAITVAKTMKTVIANAMETTIRVMERGVFGPVKET